MTTTATSTIPIDRLRRLIEAALPDLVAIRHDLHRHPELGYEEHRTCGVVKRELEQAGVEYVGDLAGGTGVMGHLAGQADKAVGLRADMDALPIEEETGAVYASTSPGTMHACGHDGHTTILIGAARVLAQIASETPLPRPVSFAFQPAEEGGAGGKRMVEEGCLAGNVLGPPVENMFGLHGWPRQPLGTVGTRVGPLLAAADKLHITVRGVGSHAAFPHVSRDPIVAAASMISSLQTIAARNVDPLDSIVISITKIEGGTTHNIIPGAVQLMGTVRTLTPETHQIAQQRIHEVAANIAQAHGCEADVDYELGYPVTLNDEAAVQIFTEVARETLGPPRVLTLDNPVMGGEDFAFYCHQVPSCFFTLGLRPEGVDAYPELHQPTFDFNDDAIATGIEMFCRLATR
jgi:amidohydrolase